MKKEFLELKQKYYQECNIDERTLPMVVHHYVSIGEQAAKMLTKSQIDKIYTKSKNEERIAEQNGQIQVITPDFQVYILTACKKLSELPPELRYDIIKKNL